jgi:hypothetical protein
VGGAISNNSRTNRTIHGGSFNYFINCHLFYVQIV